MDLIVVIALILIIMLIFRKFSAFIYCFCFIDIFLIIVTRIKLTACTGEIYAFLNEYVPASILSIFSKYSSGLFEEILVWIYIVIYIIFEYYLARNIFSKKK